MRPGRGVPRSESHGVRHHADQHRGGLRQRRPRRRI